MPDAVQDAAGRERAGPGGHVSPLTRSIATEDRLELRGLRFVAAHGALPEEAVRAQPFEVDLDLFVDLRAAGHSDDLAESVDYGELCEAVRSVMEGLMSGCSNASPKKWPPGLWPLPADGPRARSSPCANFGLPCLSIWRQRPCALPVRDPHWPASTESLRSARLQPR